MGKIKAKLILMVILTVLLVPFVLADVNIDQDNLTIVVDYKNLHDNDEYASFSDYEITLINTDNNNSEQVTINIINLNSNYKDFSVDTTSFTLSANESKIIKLSGKVPINSDQGVQENIADLEVTTASGIEKTGALSVDVQPMLELKKIYVYVNEHKEKTIEDDNEKVSDLKPGDKVELHFRLENLFHEDYDEGNIDGEITITLDESDFGEDIDESESFDLDAGFEIEKDDDEIVLGFEVPTNADKNDYELYINIDAEDDNRAKYEINLKMILEVDREKDDLRLEKFYVSPTEVSCSEKIEITAKVLNFGTNRQKNAVLMITNEELGIKEKYDFELNQGTSEDNSETKTFRVELDQNITAGTYDLTADLFYDHDEFSDRGITQLTVLDCGSEQDSDEETTNTDEQTKETEEDNDNENNTGAEQDNHTNSGGDLISSSQVVRTVESSYQNEDIMLGIMLVGVVLMFMLMIMLFVILIK